MVPRLTGLVRVGVGGLTLCLCLAVPPLAQAQPSNAIAELQPLLRDIEAAVSARDVDAFVGLIASEGDTRAVRRFARDELGGDVTTAVVRPRLFTPRDRADDPAAYDLTLDVFTERGDRGRLVTWRLDVTRSTADSAAPRWRITEANVLDSIDGLSHLTLSRERHFDATGLVIAAEDMSLRMASGSAYPVENGRGITGLVLIGRGDVTFAPEPAAERDQVRLFAGAATLEAEVTEVFVRMSPEHFDAHVSRGAFAEVPMQDDGDFDRAEAVFDEFVPLSFVIDLGDVSRRIWSLDPGAGAFVAEIRTRRYGTLTYARSPSRPEDVSLFERASERIIAMYPSAAKRAAHGRYYSDSAGVPYDVLDYRIEADFRPAGISQESVHAPPRLRGCVIDGTTRLAVRVTSPALTAFTLRLADALDVHSVTSTEFGPLLFYRIRGQHNVVIQLPEAAPIGSEFTVSLTYSGLLPPQELDENWIGRRRQLPRGTGPPFGVGAPRYVYSNSSYWYPQSTVADYAAATMDLTVPADYGVVASGEPDDDNPPLWRERGRSEQRRYSFAARQPVRYFACLISRFVKAETGRGNVALDDVVPGSSVAGSGVTPSSVALAVASSESARDRVAASYATAADILRFYASLVGEAAYPTLTVALTDAVLPGGHSPAYFAVLNHPLPRHSGFARAWAGDPVAFSGYPSFFLAHELAHQWWGQAVGWKNYHEQWLSEGVAQYFAALYAEREGGPEVFGEVIKQMRRWSLRHSAQGPVYLGNRLGRMDGEPRVFRALVYNKGAMVLHMLRRLIGDDAFVAGLRRFYGEMRFQPAGTDDLIRAFEVEAGRSLTGFFDRWIHESDLPAIDFSYRTEAPRTGEPGDTVAVLRFARHGTLFEVPVTVTLVYRQGDNESIVVPVVERVTEVRVPVRGPLRRIEVNNDGAALAEIDR